MASATPVITRTIYVSGPVCELQVFFVVVIWSVFLCNYLGRLRASCTGRSAAKAVAHMRRRQQEASACTALQDLS
jgi:hypothetical protein